MPSVSTTEVDDLFNYDAGIEDILREVDNNASNDSPKQTGNSRTGVDKSEALGLGLNEEVKIRKQRQPIAKLDEQRLLSQAGIPKLRKISKEKLKFKGNGHEFSDAVRLLSFYQLWLDNLYPRAKFSDGLAMIEKLGHSKRLQVMRREWIDEGKLKRKHSNSDKVPRGAEDRSHQVAESIEPHDVQRSTSADRLDSIVRVPNVVGNTMVRGGGSSAEVSGSSTLKGTGTLLDDDDLFFSTDESETNKDNQAAPEEDELDALLAEQFYEPTSLEKAVPGPDMQPPNPSRENMFADDLDAMNGFGV